MRKCKFLLHIQEISGNLRRRFWQVAVIRPILGVACLYSTATVGLYCTQRKLVPLSHIHKTFPSQHPPSIHQLIPMMSHLMLIWELSLTTSLCLGLFLPFVVCFSIVLFPSFFFWVATWHQPLTISWASVFLTVPWIRVWPRWGPSRSRRPPGRSGPGHCTAPTATCKHKYFCNNVDTHALQHRQKWPRALYGSDCNM